MFTRVSSMKRSDLNAPDSWRTAALVARAIEKSFGKR
jgi:hypothetical protein